LDSDAGVFASSSQVLLLALLQLMLAKQLFLAGVDTHVSFKQLIVFQVFFHLDLDFALVLGNQYLFKLELSSLKPFAF
jgi:hypothetical protein